jgi:GAF domain-containing protein
MDRRGGGAMTGPYAAILSIAKTLVEGGPMEITLQRVVESVGRAMFAESASLGSFDAERDEYVDEAGWREGGLTPEEAADIGHVYTLAEHPELRKQLAARDVTERHVDDPDLSPEWREFFRHWGLKTTLDSPLLISGRVIGLLAVEESRFVRRYTSTERALFAQLCDLAAIGINAARQDRLLAETQRRLDEALLR